MKKTDISRLRHWRPINLRIGFALSLALVILAFGWTTERPAFEDPYADFVEIGDVEIIPPTTHPEKKKMPPPPKPEPVNFEIKIDPVPITPYDPNIFDPVEPEPFEAVGKIVAPAKTASPIPPKPIEKKEPDIFRVVEEMPRFKGCEDGSFSKKEKYKCAEEKLLTYLFYHLKYPNIARDNGIQGTVVIRFIIEKNGSISNAEIVRDIGGGCGREALRVVENMPDWLPGKQRGREVPVQYNLPVRFRLN